MSGVTVQLKVEAGHVTQSLTRLGDALPRIVNADIEAVMNEARDEMATEGDPIEYPVHWDSEKQRRAYFATNGFGAGIPYKRTGNYENGWRVDKTGYGTSRAFSLSNAWSKSKYIGGNATGGAQSNIHKGRWPLVFETVRKYADKLLAAGNEAVRKVCANFGGGL